MSAPTTPSSLHAFFVFNPELGEESTEARKLLYFYDNRAETRQRIAGGQSNYVDLNYQKDLCGIAEGLIAFTREFSPDSLCESVHCQQHRYAFAQPEKDYWIVLVVKNPTIQSSSADARSGKKDAAAVHTEYLEDELDDSVLQAILHRCYSLFSLFNSSFTSIVAASTHDSLRVKLQLFMSYFLPTIRFSQLIYFTDIHGFQFLPVDKISFLSVQFLLNQLLSAGNHGALAAAGAGAAGGPGGCCIRNCALMYNNKLIYSGLNSEVMFLLYSLDQDLMYPFMVEYLTKKENLHIDIQTFIAATKATKAAATAAASTSTTPAAPATAAWTQRRPALIPGIYNVPESVYERNGRIATNRKAFDKAKNKGEVGGEEEFPEEDEEAEAEANAQQAAQQGALVEDDGSNNNNAATGAGEQQAVQAGGSTRSGSIAGSTAPFGYTTGPYRVASAATCPPCVNSPLIYLDGLDSRGGNGSGGGGGGGQKGAGSFGSGNPGVEANNPAFQVFPAATAAPSSSSSQRPVRLVIFQKFKITLFLIVEDQEEKKTNPATAAAASSSDPSAAATAQLGDLKLADSSAAASAAASSSSSSAVSPSLASPQPPLAFYSALESFMESNLKKLGEMLFEQTVRLNSAGGVVAGAPIEEPYRFLYFNHMNLALKTSLASAPSNASASGAANAPKGGAGNNAGSGGSVLTMETIKIIRELHRDFNTPSFRNKSIASLNTSNGPAGLNVPPHLQHSILTEGSTEVCVKTKTNGWVIGRRATQSHREFFMLLEDKVGNLAEIQEEVENLSRTYFYNIFIH